MVIRAPRTVDLTTEYLRTKILSGEFKADSMLPAERKLAEELGISRHTLRPAIARLEAEGLVSVRQGDGVKVRDFRATAGLDIVRHFPKEMQDRHLRAFLELRRAIALEAIGLACERSSSIDLSRLEELANLQEAETDKDRFIERDLEFSRELLRCIDNLPMELLFNSLTSYYRVRPDIARARFADLDLLRHSYTAAVELIRQGDPDLTRKATRASLELFDQQSLERMTAGHVKKPPNENGDG